MRFFLLNIIYCLFVVAPVYAGTQTLITYYPAPSGNYNKVSVNMMQYTPTTLSAIQAQYKCSYNPIDVLPPCPAGIEFYNTDAHTVYLSDGTHWKYVDTTCIPNNPCSKSLNCGTDDCGVSCGICSTPSTCSSSILGTPGSCS